MTALPLAKEFVDRAKNEKILMIERGTWWTTPVGTVQDKEVKTRDFLARNGQPVQYWSSLNHFRGFIDIFTRCLRRKNNEDGLYDITRLGKPGFPGLFGGENDGVSIVRASGVGAVLLSIPTSRFVHLISYSTTAGDLDSAAER